MKRLAYLLLFFLSFGMSAEAVPAYPGVVEVQQPDGSVLEVQTFGDEYFSYTITVDGYLVTEGADGFLEYAELDGERIVPTGVKAKAEAMRGAADYAVLSRVPKGEALRGRMMPVMNRVRAAAPTSYPQTARYPLQGEPKSLVILVNFSDVSFVTPNPQAAFEDMLNTPGYSGNGATSSARDYFIAASDSVFAPNFVVIGPYTLDNPCEYYGGDSPRQDANASRMITDACSKAYNAGVDLTEFDTDNDGRIDNVFVYYAGHNQAEGGGLNDHTVWPHRSRISNSPEYVYENGESVVVYDYSCTSELKGRTGRSMCGIGTFCHEFGHVLGLPDLYDTDYSGHTTLGSWDIMDNGSYNNDGRTPPTYSAYERFFLGWLTPEVMEPGRYELEPLIESNRAFIVSLTEHNLSGQNPSPTEFFMIENRQRVGLDEYALPGEGLLVEHIRFMPTRWNNNTVNNDPNDMGVTIVRADGTTSNLAGDTYPGSKDVHSCYFTLRDGTEIRTPLTSILEDGTTVSFQFAGGGENDPNIEIVNAPERFESYPDSASAVQVMEIGGRKLPSSVTLRAKRFSDFYFRPAGSDEEFSHSLTLYPDEEDSLLYAQVEVYMQTDIQTYGDVLTTTFTAECDSNSLIAAQVQVEMVTRRPVYVVPPVANEASGVSPYSYLASWNEVEDATRYYLTCYKITETPGQLQTDFTGFEEAAPIDWTATFNTVSTTHSASGDAAYFTNVADTLVSERYIIPVDSISYWMRPNNVENAMFIVEGRQGDSEWVTLVKHEVTTTTMGGVSGCGTGGAYDQFRMYYVPATAPRGGVAFDNFTVHSSQSLDYVLRREPVEAVDGTYLTVGNLEANTEYTYAVQASDLRYNDMTGGVLYENITDYSNAIAVRTLETGIPEDLKPKHRERWLSVLMRADGSGYTAYVPEVLDGYCLYIFNVSGMMVAKLPVTSNEVQIPRLTNGQIYILKYSPENDVRRRDKYAKLFYNIR